MQIFQVKPRCKNPFFSFNQFKALGCGFFFSTLILIIVFCEIMQGENTALKENVCSDDDRLAIIKRSLLILAESGQSLNPILSKGNKNIPSETKVQKASPPL
jgi:hypothetical protein